MSADPKQSLNKVTTGDLSPGGVLPRETFDEFFEEVQDESVVLDRVRTVSMGRSKQRIPKIGVGTRLRQPQTENTGQAESNVNTGFIDLDAEKASIYWSLTRETMEENPEREQLANTIMSLMAQQWSVDTEDLAWVGDEDDADTFVGSQDGWLEILSDRGSAVYYNTDDETASTATGTPQAPDTDMFHSVIQTLDSKYLRNDPVFMLNKKQVQAYYNSLTGRNDGLGVAVLQGDNDVTPFGYDIIGTSLIPEDKGLFTVPQNLIYALRYDLRMEVLQESDDVFDNDLFAKYKIVGKDDFQVEDENAAVRIEDIAAV